MEVAYECSRCQSMNRQPVGPETEHINCGSCDWLRPLSREDFVSPDGPEAVPARCLVCGCDDLWRQTDFPPQIGLVIVGLGATLSTIAWSQYRPVWAIGILMGFALFDLLLYALMPDVLVCYRCGARHRRGAFGESHPKFNLEISERYRQEAIRLDESTKRA